jgi:drug/metabolite transporter (DMT)-like permease
MKPSGTTEKKIGSPAVAFPALVAGAAAIGFAPIFVRLSPVEPLATAFWRMALALPPLFIWMLIEKSKGVPGPKSFSDFLPFAVAGFFFAADISVWHWSVEFTTVANATLFPNFAPVFVTLGAWVIFKHKITRLFLLGLVTALAGAFILIGISFPLCRIELLGDGLGFLTAFFYAGYQLSVSRLRQKYSTAATMAWSALFACLCTLIITALRGEALIAGTASAWWALVALALVSHVGGQGLIAFSFAHLAPALGSVSLLVQPMVAALAAWLIFGEAIGSMQAFGGVFILLGIYLARRGS